MLKNADTILKCPYCSKVVNSFVLKSAEDEIFKCEHCKKFFLFSSYKATIYCGVKKLDCMNGISQHDYSEGDYCTVCGEYRHAGTDVGHN